MFTPIPEHRGSGAPREFLGNNRAPKVKEISSRTVRPQSVDGWSRPDDTRERATHVVLAHVRQAGQWSVCLHMCYSSRLALYWTISWFSIKHGTTNCYKLYTVVLNKTRNSELLQTIHGGTQ
ncbi:hypothetical protein J6590_033826 [Homalodisca vitripennis]|nr:hypothetical protein J6590_033826 [Homalodisca vitripennis]